MTDNFYSEIPAFSDFNLLGDDSNYRDLPDDWFVVICDILGSTKAIAEGRYQDVNTLGAASVAALGEIWKTEDIPFVFGGDGASILVPHSKIEDVKKVLLRLRKFAKANYDMDMRVGLVSMREVREKKLPVEVARFVVAGKMAIAIIRGGGLTWAEAQIKGKPEAYCITDDGSESLGELKGLSCRWQPLKTQKGSVVSLLVRSQNRDAKIFGEILASLDKLLGGQVQMANPANASSMKYRTFWQTVRGELKYFEKFFVPSTLNRVISLLVSAWSFKLGWPAPFPAKEYVASIPSHSDYRKFDDMLRLVIDCTPEQVKQIRAYLEVQFAQGKIFFGLHESNHALMTCLVGNLSEGGHIHFIDGGDGGYAIAAKYLKEQMAKA